MKKDSGRFLPSRFFVSGTLGTKEGHAKRRWRPECSRVGGGWYNDYIKRRSLGGGVWGSEWMDDGMTRDVSPRTVR